MEIPIISSFNIINEYFRNITLKSVIDSVIVIFLVIKLIDFLSKTRAIHAVKGALLIYFTKIISELLGFKILSELLGYAISMLWVSLVIIFNKELRMLLEGLGRINAKKKIDLNEELEYVKIVARAAKELSNKKIGSLIVIEQQAPLDDYIETGHKLEATLSEDILMLVFENHSRFHDGAMIINKMTINSVKCFLPLSKNINKYTTYGTRHRAAVGITEISDAISVLTSEESGKISIASKGKIYQVKDEKELIDKYKELIGKNYIKDRVKKINWRE